MKYKVQRKKYLPFSRTSYRTGKLYIKYRGKTSRPKHKRS